MDGFIYYIPKLDSYIIGTVHIPYHHLSKLFPTIEKIISKVKIILPEVCSLDSISRKIPSLYRLILYGSENTLGERFSDDDLSILIKHLQEKYDIELSVDKIGPITSSDLEFFVCKQIYPDFDVNFDIKDSFDMKIISLAEDKNIVCSDLDGIWMKLTLTNDFNIEKNPDIDGVIKRLDCGIKDISMMLDRFGDEDVFDDQTTLHQREYPTIIKRNLSWLNKIINTKKAMIVVGISHVLGEDGILEMLKSRGFDVERIEK